MNPIDYRMPAEWEPHKATWLTWPKNKITWPGKKLARVEEIYLEMMKALLPGERVHLLVKDKPTAERVLKALLEKKANTSNLIFHQAHAVDTWIRDYGPIFVKRKKSEVRSQKSGVRRQGGNIAFTKWIFNAWGGKYSDLARDNGIVDRLDYLKSFKRFDSRIILEGGSIDVNGLGTLLTTEQCLLNPNRNKKFSKKDFEKYFSRYLGIKKTIWLKEGIEADDTDGHVDDITRFVGPGTIVTAIEDNKKDEPNFSLLQENLHILKKETDQNGKKFKIVSLPMPGLVGPGRSDTAHRRLPASYANFYIGNAAVLVPIYSHANDKKALKILKKVFPGRRVTGIECSDLVYGLGSIHCVTQQEPR